MDVVLFSRIQFILTTAFHIVFPILTISFALYLVVVEWLWLYTQYMLCYRMSPFFWKPFIGQNIYGQEYE